MNKSQIVWQEASGIGTSIGTALELFKDCDFTFHANEGKRVTYIFTGTKGANKGKRAVVILSNSLMPAWESGELDKASILKLPIYRVETTPDGEPLTDEDGNPITLMVFGKNASGAAGNVSKLKATKIEDFEPVSEHSFDEYI